MSMSVKPAKFLELNVHDAQIHLSHLHLYRAVAMLAEDPDFHMTLKLEPGDIELIHNP